MCSLIFFRLWVFVYLGDIIFLLMRNYFDAGFNLILQQFC